MVVLTATRGTAALVILHENDLLENWAQICLNTALRQYTEKLKQKLDCFVNICMYNAQFTAKTRYERDEPPYEAQAVIIIATMKFRCYMLKDSLRGYDVKCAWAIKDL